MSEERSGVDKRAAAQRETVRFFADRLIRFKRDEDGGLILFSLFILIMILMVAGMAVDLMRFETRRTALQNTLDTATLAATNLKREADPTTLVKDFMEKRGYDRAKVKVTPWESRVGADAAAGIEGTLVARRVSADYDLRVNAFFMPLIGIQDIGTASKGTAFERVQNVEISLVVDISGSMGGTKISDLKSSAKNFFNAVIDESRTEGITSVSVIPYNHTIVVPDALLDRLNTTAQGVVTSPATYNGGVGALTEYPLYSTLSKCIRFYDSDMITTNLDADYESLRAITPTQQLSRMAYYDPDNKSAGSGGYYARPADTWNRRCDPTRGKILPFETSIKNLEDHIDSLRAGGWTAIDNGVKWAIALLDPAFRDVVGNMVDSNLLPEKVRDRPGIYDPNDTMKVIVLMTDGANTNQYDIKSQFKSGPSRIWFSEMASTDEDPDGPKGNDDWENLYIVDSNEDGYRDRSKREEDGYFVEMPQNGSNKRWLRPHYIGARSDGVLYAESELPPDARQMHYVELYDRFSERALGEVFRDDDYGDWTARYQHRYSEQRVETGASADRRMNGSGSTEKGICDVAKKNGQVLIFSIAFQAGSHAESVMRQCATADSYYFDAANGQELSEAFASIAGAITKLRLTQ